MLFRSSSSLFRSSSSALTTPSGATPASAGVRRCSWSRRTLSAAIAAALTTGLLGLVSQTSSATPHSPAAAAAAAGEHVPVIMIPGMTGTPSYMNSMKSNLQTNGWPASRLFTWTDTSRMTQDLAKAAQELSAKVDEVRSRTGASKVVLATWSASTLAARYYIKNLDGADKVSQYIGFAGPQHGTTNNGCQWYVSCQQFASPNTPFLRALNSPTEVPFNDKIDYLTIRSANDINAVPVDTAVLAGADENYLMSGPMAPNHFQIVSNSTALAKMRSFITAHEIA
ncbi:esterase/lipase family protein [Streptomyces sp. NPDC018029]|uniref:esterase/lipase family protein n=1 Tax=Streptomyces sp. NPDC018029 TaxID=3365032 RepID=UPI0037BB282D